MKISIKVVLIAGLSFVAQQVLPWYSAVIVAFLVSAILPNGKLNAFLVGFLGVGLLWLVYALIIDIQTNSILTDRVAELFTLSDGNILVAITGLVGAVVGGLGSLTGVYFRLLFTKDVSAYY